MRTRAASAITCLAVLGACAGPRPQAPSAAAVTPPAAWRDAASIAGEPLSADWWQTFGDPVLTAIVERALANNTDIAIAAARVEEARAQVRLARSQQLPQIDAAGGGGPQRSVSAFGIGIDQTVGQAQLAISYDIDLFGRLASASASTRASLLSTKAGSDGVRLAVATAAAGGYLSLRALDARLKVLRSTAAARREGLRLATRRAEAGYSPILDQRQAEAELKAAEALIPATELAIRRQENALSVLMGDTPQEIGRGVALAGFGAVATPADVPSAVLRRRPDLLQAEQNLVATDRSLDAARAAFLPAIRLSASGGLVGSSLLPDPISIFSIGGSLLAPLFQGGRLRAQADGAAARRDQAAFAYRRTALNAFREVEDALAFVRRSQEQEAVLMEQRAALADALRLATNRYRAGYAPYLEQLDAQRALLSADLALVQVRSDRLNAKILLFQALGGGWRRDDR